MSKLEGNERWKSKMLLTEHQEQYEVRKEPKLSGHPTSEELKLIRDYVLLPHLLTMVQKNIDDVEHSSGILKRLLLAASQLLMNKITKDMYAMRRELSRRNIKVIHDEQVDLVVYHRFICRGYEERFGIIREVMRAEISVRLTKYIGEIMQMMKEQGK